MRKTVVNIFAKFFYNRVRPRAYQVV